MEALTEALVTFVARVAVGGFGLPAGTDHVARADVAQLPVPLFAVEGSTVRLAVAVLPVFVVPTKSGTLLL